MNPTQAECRICGVLVAVADDGRFARRDDLPGNLCAGTYRLAPSPLVAM